MIHPYVELRAEYEAELASMVVIRKTAVEATATRLIGYRDQYKEVEGTTGVPAVFIAALHERESGADFRTGLGQGDPWNRVSIHVPKGCGPFSSWTDAAEFYLKYDHVNDNSSAWCWSYLCWKGEAWNGFGPRAHGRRTGYLWAGTNIYDGGKYVADGVWDPVTRDQQLGIVPVMMQMVALDPTFALPKIPDILEPPLVPSPHPLPPPVGVGGEDTIWVQKALNALGADPQLVEDGSYGRRTREAVRAFQQAHGLVADGLVGPITIPAIKAAFATGEL